MTKELLSPTGEKHGLINKVGNSVTSDGFQYMSPDTKGKAEKKKKEEAKIVKAKYLNSRGQHERLEMPYCLGGGEPIQQWRFIPNYIYEVPMGLINQINDSPGLPRRSEVVDANGNPTVKDGIPERVHSFVPVSF